MTIHEILPYLQFVAYSVSIVVFLIPLLFSRVPKIGPKLRDAVGDFFTHGVQDKVSALSNTVLKIHEENMVALKMESDERRRADEAEAEERRQADIRLLETVRGQVAIGSAITRLTEVLQETLKRQ